MGARPIGALTDTGCRAGWLGAWTAAVEAEGAAVSLGTAAASFELAEGATAGAGTSMTLAADTAGGGAAGGAAARGHFVAMSVKAAIARRPTVAALAVLTCLPRRSADACQDATVSA